MRNKILSTGRRRARPYINVNPKREATYFMSRMLATKLCRAQGINQSSGPPTSIRDKPFAFNFPRVSSTRRRAARCAASSARRRSKQCSNLTTHPQWEIVTLLASQDNSCYQMPDAMLLFSSFIFTLIKVTKRHGVVSKPLHCLG